MHDISAKDIYGAQVAHYIVEQSSHVIMIYPLKSGGYKKLQQIGIPVAIIGNEGSFLIPGSRQRQTLSPLLNPVGEPGLFLSPVPTSGNFRHQTFLNHRVHRAAQRKAQGLGLTTVARRTRRGAKLWGKNYENKGEVLNHRVHRAAQRKALGFHHGGREVTEFWVMVYGGVQVEIKESMEF